MRLKFRVWDKSCNEMRYSGIAIGLDGALQSINGDLILDPNNYSIMRWTGITDCNGTDIYEEDIVQFDTDFIYKRYRIAWDNTNGAPGWHFKCVDRADWHHSSFSHCDFKNKSVRVIGNTYEKFKSQENVNGNYQPSILG